MRTFTAMRQDTTYAQAAFSAVEWHVSRARAAATSDGLDPEAVSAFLEGAAGLTGTTTLDSDDTWPGYQHAAGPRFAAEIAANDAMQEAMGNDEHAAEQQRLRRLTAGPCPPPGRGGTRLTAALVNANRAIARAHGDQVPANHRHAATGLRSPGCGHRYRGAFTPVAQTRRRVPFPVRAAVP